MDAQDIIALALVYAIIVVSLVLSLLNDKYGWGYDTRKIVHVGVGNFVFVWWAFSEQWIMLAFFAVPFEIILILAALDNNPFSKTKLGDISNNKGHRYGLVLYVFSIILMILFMFDHWVAASVGIIALTYGDGAGSVFGKKYGKHKAFNEKSLEGTAAIFVVSAVMSGVVLVFYWLLGSSGLYPPFETTVSPFVVPLVVGFVAAAVELVSPGQIDNLSIPFSTAGACMLMGL